eukprot:Hpha_TRINITY_DN15035_c4_g3::TRINITY_DN15035_c4_g3_i2::g.123130::m.123130
MSSNDADVRDVTPQGGEAQAAAAQGGESSGAVGSGSAGQSQQSQDMARDVNQLRSQSALSFDVSAITSDPSGPARRSVSQLLDVEALRRLTTHGRGARSQPMLSYSAAMAGSGSLLPGDLSLGAGRSLADATSPSAGNLKQPEERSDVKASGAAERALANAAIQSSAEESAAEASSSGVEDPLPQLALLGRLGDDFQPTYNTAQSQHLRGTFDSRGSRGGIGPSTTASAPAGTRHNISSPVHGQPSATRSGTLTTITEDNMVFDEMNLAPPTDLIEEGEEADDEEDLRLPGTGPHQKHPFATLVINGYQLLRCHFPSFHRETTSRSFPLHHSSTEATKGPSAGPRPAAEATCKAGYRFRFVCYTHYSCPRAYNIRARVVMDGNVGEPSVEIDLGVLRPKTEVISASHTLPFAPSNVRFTLKKMNVNHGFSVDLENQFVDLVEKMALAEIETQGLGSLSAFHVQCRFEDTDMYKEIVSRKYNNSWYKFLLAHRDRFNVFSYTREEIAKSNLYPYAKFHEPRILIKGKEHVDFKQRDQVKAQERNVAERTLLDRIELILKRSPEGWVNEHELLRYLQQDQSFLAFLSPMYSALMRFMRRHRDHFVWITQPFLPTRFALKEIKGEEAKAFDSAKKHAEVASAGGPKVPAVTIRHGSGNVETTSASGSHSIGQVGQVPSLGDLAAGAAVHVHDAPEPAQQAPQPKPAAPKFQAAGGKSGGAREPQGGKRGRKGDKGGKGKGSESRMDQQQFQKSAMQQQVPMQPQQQMQQQQQQPPQQQHPARVIQQADLEAQIIAQARSPPRAVPVNEPVGSSPPLADTETRAGKTAAAAGALAVLADLQQAEEEYRADRALLFQGGASPQKPQAAPAAATAPTPQALFQGAQGGSPLNSHAPPFAQAGTPQKQQQSPPKASEPSPVRKAPRPAPAAPPAEPAPPAKPPA